MIAADDLIGLAQPILSSSIASTVRDPMRAAVVGVEVIVRNLARPITDARSQRNECVRRKARNRDGVLADNPINLDK